MRKPLRQSLLAVILLVCVGLLARLALAQTEGGRYFAETGHWVTGDFLQVYDSAPDALLVYGYPITDAFANSNGLTIQYFQRARFELHPENPVELRVVLSPLGEYVYQVDGPGEVVPVSSNLTACRNIPEDGFPVCYAFLEFFDAYGGIAQFGYPISELEIHNDLMVQYFQRARFEWHPELPSGQRVVLTDLGSRYFSLYENPARLLPSLESENIPNTVLSLQARAFVGRAVMPASGTQIVYIVVQDQNLRPVENVQVTVVVRLPTGEEARYVTTLTNDHGVTSLPFTFRGQPNGIAEIFIFVTSDEMEDRTRTSFRVWW